MRQITAGLIAITVWIALDRVFQSADPLLNIIFALIAFSAGWVFVLWKDLMPLRPEHAEAEAALDISGGARKGGPVSPPGRPLQ
jgi:hypothetical protein